MNLKNHIILLILFLIFSNFSYCQINKLIPCIDSMIFRNTLTSKDIYLPRDYYEIHPGRNRFNERLLESHIYSFDIASFYESEIKNLNINTFEPFFGHVFNDLGLAKIEIAELNPMIPRLMLNDMLGVNVDSVFGSVGAIIMSRYLANFLACRSILDKNFNNINFNELSELIKYADSIIYNPNYNSDNIYEYSDNLKKIKDNSANVISQSYYLDSLRILSAGFSFLIEIIKLNDNFKINFKDAKKHIKTTIIETKYGKIALGGTGNDHYKGDFALIVDLGGDDVYDIEINSKNDAIRYPLRLIVDFMGNDKYRSGSYGLASGYFGVGLILDLAGNDSYEGGDFSLGCGIFGLGGIIDYSGNDTYKSHSFSQASSVIGMGFLIDYSGNDSYTASHFSQSFAGPKSFSFLHDKAGNDRYIIKTKRTQMSFSQAVSVGLDDLWGGGIAVLIDEAGIDTFSSTNVTQSFAIGHGFTALINYGSNATYTADNYAQSVSIGNSHSILADFSTESIFRANSFSQAFSDKFAFSGISAINNAILNSNNKFNNSSGLGIIINNTGLNDTLTYKFVEDIEQKYWHKYIFSSSNSLKIETIFENQNTSNELSKLKFPITSLNLNRTFFKEPKLSNELNDLLLIASSDKLTTQMNESALDRIIADTAMTYVAFGIILSYDADFAIPACKKFYNELDQFKIIKMLEDSLRSVNKNVITNSAELLVELNSIKSFDKIVEQCNNVNWLVRGHIARLIGRFNKGSYSVILRTLIDDFHPYVRASAAYALALSDPTADNLLKTLNDELFIVRNYACLGLIDRKKVDFKLFKRIIDNIENINALANLATVFPYLDIKSSEKKLFETFINNAPVSLIKALHYNQHLISDAKHLNLIEKRFNKPINN